jgi:hypothetical protein
LSTDRRHENMGAETDARSERRGRGGVTDSFNEAWGGLEEQGRAELHERKAALFRLFAGGGAGEEECSCHLENLLGGLAAGGHYDTLAVVLRGFGFTEEKILASIKRRLIAGHMPAGYAWDALRKSGITPDAAALVAALQEIDDASRLGGDEEIPF